jgi:hypothetical protein
MSQTLPREKIALFLDAQKQTGDICEPVRYFLSKANARKFYIEELGWTSEQFEAVDWDALHWTCRKRNSCTHFGYLSRLQSFVALEYRSHE